MDIKNLLKFTVDNNASDLHLSANLAPMVRIDGALRTVNAPNLEPNELETALFGLLTEEQQQQLTQEHELDFSYYLENVARFRVNCFLHSRGLGAVFRVIPNVIKTFADLELPKIFERLASYRNGLVLVTGPTGSGKSTTLAAMIDYINQNRREHILTIEDPIEFVHQSQKSLINQRELHHHTHSFANALRSALREDPDVILVGELRDLDTIRLALTAAETGHLVFGTLHTISAAKTIDRLIDVFPGEEKDMIRSMLSESLRAVISQTLIPKENGGRVAAQEIMIVNSAIRNLIRENKVAQMYSVLQTNVDNGMQTLDQHLEKLVRSKKISKETAQNIAVDKTIFED